MRHKKKFNHLSRKRGHRHAMLANMAASLILHKRITTTTAKAKALKVYFEPLITKAKDDTTHARRQVFSYLQDKEATSELFREVAAKVGDRPGGYTRIIKLGNRLGDNADMCIIELVDYNENLLSEKESAAKSARRRRGAKKKSQVTETEATPDSVKETVPSEEMVADEPVAEVTDAEAEVTEVETQEAEVTAEETLVEEKEDTTATETKAEEDTEKEDKPSANADSDDKAADADESEEEKKA